MDTLADKINALIDLHNCLDNYEIEGTLREDRCQYSKWLVEQELLEEGHSLKGIMHCSKIRHG